MDKKNVFLVLLCLGLSVSPSISLADTNIALAAQQAHQITGIVLDEANQPVIGVTVRIKGNSNTGTITDANGKFSIKASPNDVIQFSYIGYADYEVKVGKQHSLTVNLKPDNKTLNEVVITAFGTGQKKASIVGSIQTVRPKDLVVPSSNLSNAFAGRLAGVVAFQRSGQPGSNASNFYIRGISTISGMTSPLIIVDGVEVSASDLNSLDPEIIESFSILKDATATAMYGTRGANGVMIITTKSGANLEKPIIGVRVEANMTQPTKVPKFVDGAQYMEMFNEAVTGESSGNTLYTTEQIINTRNHVNKYIYPDVDWYNEIFKEAAFNQKANFNIRGGTKKITYFMNIGANHETGMIKNVASKLFSYRNNIDYLKYTFQNNIDFHMSKSSTISLRLNVQLNDLRQPKIDVKSLYSDVMNSNPVDFPTCYPQGSDAWVHWGAWKGGNTQGAQNPLARLTQGYQDMFESTVIANVVFEQKLDMLLKGLRFKALISYKNWNRTTTNREQPYNKYVLDSFKKNPDGSYTVVDKPFDGTPTKPVLSTNSSTAGDRRFYVQSFFDYNTTFGKHNIGALLLWNIDQYNNNVPNGLIASLPQRKMGFAARASYSYDNKYMVEVNAGYNGSENFAPGHRWGFFPSVAIGWNISQEKFWESLANTVSNLKLRASYGLVGNDQLRGERFLYMSDITLQDNKTEFTTGDRQQTTLKGPVYTRFENKSITWEVGRKLNVGFDMQLFRALNINFDVFNEIRSNIFQQRQSIPNYLGTGRTKVFGNLAKVKNWGFDLAMDYGKVINKDLAIQFKGTFTFSRNRIIEYDEAPGLRPSQSMIGRSAEAIFGYVANGLYIDEADIAHSPVSQLGNIRIAPGDIKYVDQPDENGKYDNKITSEDKIQLGYPTVPEIIYGFGPSISYRHWDFSFFFQGVCNTSMMLSGFAPFGTQYNRNVLKWIADDYWSHTNQNPKAAYPRITKNDNNHNTQPSTFWLRDAQFLKLKNVEVGYTYKKARFYVSGVNLLTSSPFKYWDPEMGGGKGLSYPTQRVVNLGVQITFNN